MSAIRLEDVTRSFGKTRAVDGISATIADGEFFTLLGPSGCGKTTLLRMIAGFTEVEHGRILFGDQRIDTVPAHQRNIGMVFQNYAVFPNLTVEHNVAYGLRARSVPAADRARRVARALDMVQLGQHGARWPHELSGGQLQRVAIARSLVIEPSVLLFDEPLSNLDAQLRTHMRVEIRQLQRQLGITAVYVTHDQEEALAVSDRIAVLRAGRIEQIGPPEAIYRTPQTAFVAEFMGSTNMLTGVLARRAGPGGVVSVGGTEIHVATIPGESGARVALSLRPETLRLADDQPSLPARLVMREFLGPITILHATLPDGTPIRAALLAGQAPPDEALALAYDPAQITAFAAP